jgi:glycosyltransferase involved in cell wall biosynthesis
MKLLILTQKVDKNDDILAFMHSWINEFAKQCEQVTVVCLYQGECELPDNVKVFSLGKDSITNYELRITNKFKYLFRFYKYIWRERKNYDAVFVHMNAEYVVLGGWLWKLMSKKIGLWYAHGYVPLALKMAEKFADIIFTSTVSGCRLNSKKIKVVGQGIDVEKFKSQKSKVKSNGKYKIITVGRISPVKDLETSINAIRILIKKGINLQYDIIGGAGLPEQEKYLDDLKSLVKEKNLENNVNFLGSIPNKDIVLCYQAADLFLNSSRTGSLDKTMIEAMACGVPVLTCNESMLEVLGDIKNSSMFAPGDSKILAEKAEIILGMKIEEKENLSKKLRNIAVENHSVQNLITKILKNYE